MPAFDIANPPVLSGDGTDAEKLRAYLLRMADALRYVLGNLDESNIRSLPAANMTGFVRGVEEIARAMIGKAQIGAAQVQQLDAMVAKITTAVIQTAVIQWAQIDNVAIDGAQIKTATIDLAKIKGVSAGSVIAASMVGGKLQISNLGVTEANIVSLTAGEIVLKGSDGLLYALTVDENGSIASVPKLIGNNDVGAGSIDAGEKLVENSITAKLLNVEEILANSALIARLTANEAFISSLTAADAFVGAIRAMGGTIDLSANDAIALLAGKISAAQDTADNAKSGVDQYRTRILIDADGMHIKADDTQNTELNLRNDMIRLIDALGNVCVTIAQQLTTMPSAKITESMQLGGGVWRNLSSGALALMKA